MIASTRRSVVAMLLGIGLVDAGLLPRPAQAAPSPGVRLPEGPLRLTRVLERGVGDDGTAAITIRRWWDVTFERQGRGIIATGRQIGAEVSAPPPLAELARMEQQRDASAMFPLMLTDGGTILTPPETPTDSDGVNAALRAAERMIARQPLPAEERARIGLYLAEVHRAGSGLLNALPGDLLFPTGVPISQRETVALPGGLTGEFSLLYLAAAQSDAPWLARAERRVITRVAGSKRQAAETWTMGPL